MNHACIDASVAVKWVLPEEMNYTAARLLQAGRSGRLHLVAPPCVAFRAGQAIERWVLAGCLKPEDAREAAAHLRRLLSYVETVRPPTGGPGRLLLLHGDGGRRWAYDSDHLTVAEKLDCDLWTADPDLARELTPRYRGVRWLGDFVWP